MKVGTRVEVTEHFFISELVGVTGTLVEERLPQSQLAMLCGVSSWKVNLDTPITLYGETLVDIVVREDALTTI